MHDDDPRNKTRPLPAGGPVQRRWRLTVNGVNVTDVRHMTLSHPDFGVLAYGLTPGGYDGWTFHEVGGGGSVVLPYCAADDHVLVGLVEQSRPLQGGTVLNAPRGFVDRGELYEAAARRELLEEMGLDVAPDALQPLPGQPANPNSAFFETARDEGVRFFSVCLEHSMLRRDDGDSWALVPGVIRDDASGRHSRLRERIRGARFLPWYEAAGLGDMFTNAAVARLLASLRKGAR